MQRLLTLKKGNVFVTFRFVMKRSFEFEVQGGRVWVAVHGSGHETPTVTVTLTLTVTLMTVTVTSGHGVSDVVAVIVTASGHCAGTKTNTAAVLAQYH